MGDPFLDVLAFAIVAAVLTAAAVWPRGPQPVEPRLRYPGGDQAHLMTVSDHLAILGRDVSRFGVALGEALLPPIEEANRAFLDLLASTRPLSLRERVEFWAHETAAAIRATFH